ncbi:histidine kinase osmosensor [Asimina triloba]
MMEFRSNGKRKRGNGLLSPKGVNFEVQALIAIKTALKDPHNVLQNWDPDSRNSQPELIWYSISKHRELNKSSARPIPAELGKLPKLRTVDLSDNLFTGEIPSSIGNLKNLEYLYVGFDGIEAKVQSE